MEDLNRAYRRAVEAITLSVTNVQEGEWGDREWERIAVNVEIDDDRRISAQTAAIARYPGGALEDIDFRLSRAAKDALFALRSETRNERGVWNTCDIIIERSGKFSLEFSYDAPRRLGGDLLHSPFNGYLERYLAETASR